VGSCVGLTVVGDLDVGVSVTTLLGLAVGTAVAGISVDGGIGAKVDSVGAKVSGSVGAKVSGFTLFVGRVGPKVGEVGKAVGDLEGFKEVGVPGVTGASVGSTVVGSSVGVGVGSVVGSEVVGSSVGAWVGFGVGV
jgi:hypothetical protein